jgi:hypothetical protein
MWQIGNQVYGKAVEVANRKNMSAVDVVNVAN